MKRWHLGLLIIIGLIISTQTALAIFDKQNRQYEQEKTKLEKQLEELKLSLDQKSTEFETYKQTDQIVINQKLEADIKEIKKSYNNVVSLYERLIDLRGEKKQYSKIDSFFAQAMGQLAENNYASASATIANLDSEIKKELDKKAIAVIPQVGNVASGGDTVKTQSGDFRVNIISADLKTTKVVVDTASTNDCADNCPVMSLAAFAQRSGAYAAINGPYFCPATYPTCANKKNSFDTLIMNKNKTYFNSSNNIYSSVPAAIFSTSSRFVSKSQEWGRDTGIDSVIAGQPLLVFNGQSQFSGDGDPKKSGKGTRAFIGATDSTVYIGLIYNATVAEAATVIAAKGIRNAVNLDSGGSIAMWNNGRYMAGPGRDLPFGIMLVRR